MTPFGRGLLIGLYLAVIAYWLWLVYERDVERRIFRGICEHEDMEAERDAAHARELAREAASLAPAAPQP